MFNKGDVLELYDSNMKYTVVDYIDDDGRIYVILAEQEDPTIIKYAAMDGDCLKVIQDQRIIEYITSKIKK